MKKKKNLLIACHSEKDSAGLRKAFSNLEQICLLPLVSTGRDAIDAVLSQDVDLLLLDLVMPSGDGLDVLDFITRLHAARRPMVFMITAFSDDRLLSAIQDRVAYCFTKPIKYELVLLRVLQLANTNVDPAKAPKNESRILLETQISASIRAIGIPPHLKGYYYLREAIRLYAETSTPYLVSVTNDIYPKVAEIFHTKPTLVEHAIRNAIEIAWARGNIDTLHAYFGYTINDCRGKPSNYEFIAMMAERAITYVDR